jgi:hypothetical protein
MSIDIIAILLILLGILASSAFILTGLATLFIFTGRPDDLNEVDIDPNQERIKK